MRGTLRLGVVALVAAACRGGSGSGAAVTRDSAGIRIVENQGSAWTAAQAWTVVDSPLVDIGGKAGEPEYELDQVRGPVHLGDGTLVLGNAATSQLRFYDASGKHLRSTGRQGSGPGEFLNITLVFAGPGDSLLVSDVLARRNSVFDQQGTFARGFSLGGQSGGFVPVNGKVEVGIPTGWFSDGSVVALSQTFAINQAREGVYRDSLTVIRYGPDGAVRDTLGRFPGAEMETMKLSVGAQEVSVPQPVPLGKQTVMLVSGQRFFLSFNNAWEIVIHQLNKASGSATGVQTPQEKPPLEARTTLVRADVSPVSLTEGQIAVHRKEMIDAVLGSPQMRNLPEAIKQQMSARYEQAKYPKTIPFFALFLSDPAGNLWAQEVVAPGIKAQRYAVVDSSGRLLGRVTMPTGFQPTSVGTDAVYGVWKDAEDVEHVRGYRLRKP